MSGEVIVPDVVVGNRDLGQLSQRSQRQFQIDTFERKVCSFSGELLCRRMDQLSFLRHRNLAA